jgi:hypothetical protein
MMAGAFLCLDVFSGTRPNRRSVGACDELAKLKTSYPTR